MKSLRLRPMIIACNCHTGTSIICQIKDGNRWNLNRNPMAEQPLLGPVPSWWHSDTRYHLSKWWPAGKSTIFIHFRGFSQHFTALPLSSGDFPACHVWLPEGSVPSVEPARRLRTSWATLSGPMGRSPKPRSFPWGELKSSPSLDGYGHMFNSWSWRAEAKLYFVPAYHSRSAGVIYLCGLNPHPNFFDHWAADRIESPEGPHICWYLLNNVKIDQMIRCLSVYSQRSFPWSCNWETSVLCVSKMVPNITKAQWCTREGPLLGSMCRVPGAGSISRSGWSRTKPLSSETCETGDAWSSRVSRAQHTGALNMFESESWRGFRDPRYPEVSSLSLKDCILI